MRARAATQARRSWRSTSRVSARSIDFKRRVDKVARDLRSSKPMPGGAQVRYPGLQGHRTASERQETGIPIRLAFVAGLDKLASELSLAPLVLHVKEVS